MAASVFVFGAGATRGCSFVNPERQPCLPPLDRDFFTQLQRVRNQKYRNLVAAVISDVVGLFGKNFGATLESTFATLEQMMRMLLATRETRDFKVSTLRDMRNRLLLAVAAVLEEALTESPIRKGGRREPAQCEHLERFVKECLRAGDTIITFNYDCALDYHLKNFGEGKWNARYGYGVNLGPRGSRLKGDAHWQPSRPAKKGETVRLLKLHGSLHFKADRPDEDEYVLVLKQRPYTYQGRGMRFTIIPPEYVKRFDAGLFRDIWNEAFKAIARARNLIFVGYSLPVTDAHATALFRSAVKGNGLNALVVANPDRDARMRIRGVVLRGLSDRTRVLSLESLAEFVAVPRDVWDVQ